MADRSDRLVVGGLDLDREEVRAGAKEYLRDGTRFSYPAYDLFEGGGGPDELSDGDLLAYGLLNVPPRLPAYYSLLAVRPSLNRWLEGTDPGLSLVDADDEALSRLGDLFAVLDVGGLSGVRGTILAKVMHRKRPGFVPLYDRYVYRVYVGHESAPMQPDRKRSWRQFMPELARQMRSDLSRERGFFQQIAALGERSPVTSLRALDIVVWQAGQRLGSTPEEPDDEVEGRG